MTRHYIGADLSKDWIDLSHLKIIHIADVRNERAKIQEYLFEIQNDEVIIFEATSGCDDICWQKYESLKHHLSGLILPMHGILYALAIFLKQIRSMPKCSPLLVLQETLNRKLLTALPEIACKLLLDVVGNIRI